MFGAIDFWQCGHSYFFFATPVIRSRHAVAIFAFTFLGERPASREWFGIALVATGVVVLALKR